MTSVVRRRLASLEPMIEAYTRKAWYTVPSARSTHGVDPNAPREPAYFGPLVRLAARVVDVKAGGNPANVGDCECAPCDCPSVKGQLCSHDRACRHTGVAPENEHKVSENLRALVGQYPALAYAFGHGGDAVYALAGLTPSETEVARYIHEGLSQRSVANVTGRQFGTVRALCARVNFKLHALALEAVAA